MTITAEFLKNGQTLKGKPTEKWEVKGAKNWTEAVSAIPGDFEVYYTVDLDGSRIVEIIRQESRYCREDYIDETWCALCGYRTEGAPCPRGCPSEFERRDS